jgi:hypothetical protein
MTISRTLASSSDGMLGVSGVSGGARMGDKTSI